MAALENTENFVRCANFAAGRSNLTGISSGNFFVVDNSGGGHDQRLHTQSIGFQLFEPLAPDYFETLKSIRKPATMKLVEPRYLLLAGGDDDFPAQLVGDIVLIAEFNERFPTGHAGAGFERTGAIVKSGMNDAAIVAGLVLREIGFLVEQQKFRTWVSARELQRRGEANNAAADNRNVVLGGHNQRRFRTLRDTISSWCCEKSPLTPLFQRGETPHLQPDPELEKNPPLKKSLPRA